MKTKVKQWIAVLAAVLLLTAAISPTVFAMDFFNTFNELMGGDFGDLINELIGGNNNNGQNGLSLSDLLQNPGGMLDTLRERLADLDVNASNTAIAEAIMALMNGNSVNDLRSLVNSNDFINQLADYLTNQQATTTTTQPSTTAPTTTTAPATTAAPTTTAPYSTDLQAPSIVIPSVSYTYTYQGAQTYSTEATTADIYATEPPYSYMEPAVSYTNTLTTVPFTPVYEDDGSSLKNSSSVKLVIGICVLILSAGSIAAIVVMLKKNKA